MSSSANNHGPTYTVLALGSLEGDLESVSSQYLVNTKQQIWDLEMLSRTSLSRVAARRVDDMSGSFYR